MPTPSATSTQGELQANVTSYAREILEFDRPTAVPKDQWDGKVESHLAGRFFDLPDWFAKEVSQVKKRRMVTKYREERKNALDDVDTGLRIFTGIMSFGTTELAGVAATTTVRVPYEEEETYTEDVTEYRLNKDKFQQWVLNARQDVNAFFRREETSNQEEVQQVEALLQRLEERIALLEQSNARHDQIEQLRREFHQQLEQNQLTSQQVQNVAVDLRARMDEMERMQRDGADLSDADFQRWAGTPMRAI